MLIWVNNLASLVGSIIAGTIQDALDVLTSMQPHSTQVVGTRIAHLNAVVIIGYAVAGDIRAKLPKVLKPPKGEAYARLEGPKGEIGHFAADGTAKPYRDNVRAPSFVNQTCLSQIAVGHKLAILGSFDIVMGEVDR